MGITEKDLARLERLCDEANCELCGADIAFLQAARELVPEMIQALRMALRLAHEIGAEKVS